MSLAETFAPRDWQAQIIGDPKNGVEPDSAKYKVVVAHRKAGKTVMALMELFMRAYLHNQRETVSAGPYSDGRPSGVRIPRFTYIAPTYVQGRDIAWDLLKDIVPRSLCFNKPNETRMEINLRSQRGDRVILNIKGADKEDSLRGPGLYFALLDEYAYMKPQIWPQIIRPELGASGGGAMFIGTPNGRDHFYELFQQGQHVEGWKSWLLPATRATVNFRPGTARGQQLLSAGFLEEVQNETTQKFFAQEYECEFNDNAGMVFERVMDNVIDEVREFPEAGHRYRIGFDPALKEDFSVWAILDLTDHKVKYIYRTNRIDADILVEKTQNLATQWTTNAGKCEIVMDTTGIGDPIYDFLTKRGTPIVSVKFTNDRKALMVKTLNQMLSRREIQFPRYDWLLEELTSYKYDRLPSGRYRYSAPQGMHDDGVTSLLLLTHELPPLLPPISFQRLSYPKQYNKFTGLEL